MKLYLATGNLNKKREMEQILSTDTIIIPADMNFDFHPKETGSTFYENSIIKARELWNQVHTPVLADDSGICVDAINGRPGIFSARYAGPDFPQGKPNGEKINQRNQNIFLIKETNNAIEKNSVISSKSINGPRSARYVCSMVLFISPYQLYVVQETMEGTIVDSIEKAAGDGGFGYDPIFFLPSYNKTAAELTSKEKNDISHRGKATRKILAIIDELKSSKAQKNN